MSERRQYIGWNGVQLTTQLIVNIYELCKSELLAEEEAFELAMQAMLNMIKYLVKTLSLKIKAV